MEDQKDVLEEEIVEEESQPTETFTQEQVDAIISQRLAREKAKSDQAIAELKQQQEEADKLRKMNAEQKASYEKEKLETENENLRKQLNLINMKSEAKTMLVESGVSIDDNLLSLLVKEDAETTKTAIESFTTAFNTAVEEKTKELLKGEPPRFSQREGLTKESIFNIENEKERQALIAKNLELFRQ